MKISLFLAIVLVSGAVAGLIHGSTNLALVEPYLDEAIGIENQNMFEAGEAEDTPAFWVEYESYRIWQKGGQVLAGVILGTSFGALFGIIFALSRNSLPGNNDIKKALVLGGVMWTTLYFIPFLKYPANPPTVGDPETIVIRSILYVSFIALSGLGAFGFYKISKKFENKRNLVAISGYSIFIIAVFFAMPSNTDEITAPAELVDRFRIMSVLGVSSFWISVSLILGCLWNHFKPHQKMKTYN